MKMNALKSLLYFFSFICTSILWGTLLSLPSVSLADECREIETVVRVTSEIRAWEDHGDKDIITLTDPGDNTHYCFLTQVKLDDVWANNCWAGCIVYKDSNDQWFVEAYTDGSGDDCTQGAECMAECFEWKYE